MGTPMHTCLRALGVSCPSFYHLSQGRVPTQPLPLCCFCQPLSHSGLCFSPTLSLSPHPCHLLFLSPHIFLSFQLFRSSSR